MSGTVVVARDRAPHRVRRSPLMSRFSQLLRHPIPVTLVFVGFVIVALAASEIGFRIGRWWQLRLPGQQEGIRRCSWDRSWRCSPSSSRSPWAWPPTVSTPDAGSCAMRRTRSARRSSAPDTGGTVRENIQNLLREYVPLRIENRDETQLEASLRAVEDDPWTTLDADDGAGPPDPGYGGQSPVRRVGQ